MDKVEWIVALSRWDIVEYLSKHELADLSVVCKFLRNKLYQHVFKRIKLRYFLDNYIDLTFNEICSTKIKRQVLESLNENLKGFILFVKSLNNISRCNESLLLSISQLFLNLNSLKLTESMITLATFDKIMCNLTKLEHLSLNDIKFVSFDTSEDPLTLHFPKSLISFNILNGTLTRKEYSSSFKVRDYFYNSPGFIAGTLKFNVEKDSLPNLKILRAYHFYQDFIGSVISLLSATRVLSHLSTSLLFINESTLANLHLIKSLTIINSNTFSQNIIQVDISAFQNLKELEISGKFVSYNGRTLFVIGQGLNVAAKNIKRLALKYFEINRLLAEEFKCNFPNLVELSLFNAGVDKAVNLNNLPKSIQALNFYNINPKLLDINTIINYPELKFISVTYESGYPYKLKFEHIELFSNIEGWREIHFPGPSIKCYKQ
ncbi:hypothetical protein CONCODRAFT_69615 [Conidiobolus coronatus NRRL 28638]|uniref:F-box domain-containing protein n=1 Tax=Conidiobolus coronatus (strain ATCC 28846 / CBS 209.66 / NRRL 28638) TaxID=796925 RepID=A0A137P9U4_CONC2|nr:hypothetical protein CONCODRAFT_69615 [Conidiobolus coronatus NRRL 28638]|eukprot:KXN71752.1 hypothetical protein CONCODRAFT_69615 [Conidiobolus coronatus NRRL 28638]